MNYAYGLHLEWELDLQSFKGLGLAPLYTALGDVYLACIGVL